MKSKFIASVDENVCVCCGACHEVCPTSAITTPDGCHATVSTDLCVGCGKCSRICPTGCFCNRYCGRGKLFAFIPRILGKENKKVAPAWLYSKYFRYGFLAFFMTMFGNMVYQTYLVFAGSRSLRTAIKLFWTFKIPFKWAYTVTAVPEWVIQYSYGFYSLMLTSTLIGLIVMALYRPRTWCAFCPMGTMTQGICKMKNQTH